MNLFWPNNNFVSKELKEFRKGLDPITRASIMKVLNSCAAINDRLSLPQREFLKDFDSALEIKWNRSEVKEIMDAPIEMAADVLKPSYNLPYDKKLLFSGLVLIFSFLDQRISKKEVDFISLFIYRLGVTRPDFEELVCHTKAEHFFAINNITLNDFDLSDSLKDPRVPKLRPNADERIFDGCIEAAKKMVLKVNNSNIYMYTFTDQRYIGLLFCAALVYKILRDWHNYLPNFELRSLFGKLIIRVGEECLRVRMVDYSTREYFQERLLLESGYRYVNEVVRELDQLFETKGDYLSQQLAANYYCHDFIIQIIKHCGILNFSKNQYHQNFEEVQKVNNSILLVMPGLKKLVKAELS
jgi:hypothetical protein